MDNTYQTIELSTPSIAINGVTGEITATVRQPAGYVEESEKSISYNLVTQSAINVMPTTHNQVAVPRGYYTIGDVVVQGDAGLVPENIRKGVRIFGVVGTYEGE